MASTEQLQAIRRIRDYAVALSLAPTPPPIKEAEQLIVARQQAELAAESRTQAEGKRLLQNRLTALAEEIASLAAKSEPDERLVEHEERLVDTELKTLDAEEKEATERVSSARLSRHEARVRGWHEGVTSRDRRRQRLTDLRDRLWKQLQAAEARLSAVRDPLASRTVAGFLLWAGYSAVAATGAAVAYLLGRPIDRDVIADLASAMSGMSTDLHSLVPAPYVLPVAIATLIGILASVAGAVWLCDKLIQHFDKTWRQQAVKDSGHSRVSLGLPSPEVGRRAYVQALALLPFGYIAGVTLLFLTHRASTSARVIERLTPAILHITVGSIATLLASSMFVLYAIKVIEPRQARRAWEIALLPLILLAVFGVAMLRPQPDRLVWGSLATFMVLGSIGLAYGIVYRGMFRDVDEVARVLRMCDRELEELEEEPELEDPGKAERRELANIARAFRQRRQAILDEARKRRLTERQKQINDLDQDIANTAQSDARVRLAAARLEHSIKSAELAGADIRAEAAMARLLERQALEIEEFRR
ncbi:MAG TPA: hypothetical protein VJU79_04605, partial [Candidatus Dormibacteraeota bacterium]|nr:hypothetical protein [Candidatus Dormibacteraeota bacterium]